MRFLTGLLLFIFFSMFIEDAISAHAGAADLTACQQEKNIEDSHNQQHSPSDPHHRDISHFGHNSFLLIEPIYEKILALAPRTSITAYIFSVKLGFVEIFIRPPIF